MYEFKHIVVDGWNDIPILLKALNQRKPTPQGGNFAAGANPRLWRI
ncbi:MAG: hypothetical protein ACLUKN_16395 [Bacilli bacterium]